MKYKVGDLVWMSEVCLQKIVDDEYDPADNPMGEIGYIKHIRWGAYEVEWSSGHLNSYLDEDLELYEVYEPYTDEDLESMIG